MSNNSEEPKELTKPSLLVVEGPDDERFFLAFFKNRNINNIQIENLNGKDNLKKVLKALPTRPGYNEFLTSIGIIKDADKKTGKEVFKSVTDMLKQAKLPVPANFAEFTNGKPQVGIFIFPSEDESGELEDLVLESIETSTVMNCVNNFIKCAGELNTIKKPAKARLYAWLSVQERSNLRLGEAADRNLFDFSHTCFNNLATFINNLNTIPLS